MPNKLLARIKSQAKDLKVDATLIFQEVVPSITDGMTTTEIDELIAFKSADKTIIHPDYALLGGRILMSRQAKLIGKELQPVDYTYDFFAATTFLVKYSMKVDNKPIELPSCMYKRVASALAINSEEEKLFLEELNSKRMNFATPIYTNVGIPSRGCAISCNLSYLKSDSIEGIEETLTKIAYASKEGAGVGLLLDPLRSKESYVSSFSGKAGGIVRMADMVQSKMRFYKQGSRSGSCALYLSVWHRDILDFLELTLPIGEEKLRTRDLFLAVVINDLFMKKLESGEKWHLFCPNDIKKAGLRQLHELWGEEFEEEYEKAVDMELGYEIDPKEIWDMIIKSQVESGRPYVMFKDNANRRNMQSNIGVITQSNLCIYENMQVEIIHNSITKLESIQTVAELVAKGETILIKSFDTENTKIEYQKILNAFLTNESAEVIEILDEDTGNYLICTPDHEIYTKNRGYVKAIDLIESDVLEFS